MEDPAHQLEDGGALFNGEGFAHGLAADGQAGDQGRDGQGDHHGAEGKGLLEPGDDDGGGGAGDNAADVAHHVVAEAGNLAGLPDEAQGLPGAGGLMGGHGVEGPLVGGGDRHADDIKQDAQADEAGQHRESQGDARPAQRLIRRQAQHGGEDHGDEKYLDRPAESSFLFPLVVLLLFLGLLLCCLTAAVSCVQERISSLSKI